MADQELKDFSEMLIQARSSRHLYMDSCKIKNLMLRVEGFNFIYQTDLSGLIVMGAHSYINPGSRLKDVAIGRYCSIAEGVVISPEQHSLAMVSTHPHMISKSSKPDPNLKRKGAIIGHDVWIGTNTIIMPGIEIGNGSVVGANSVVTKSLPPYSIAVGVPAKIIKFRFSDSIIERLQAIKWWDYSMGNIEGIDFNDVEGFLDYLMSLKDKGALQALNSVPMVLKCNNPTIADNMYYTRSRV
jgi:acetyltransferase-like isoleucine patch superfamily enzyme